MRERGDKGAREQRNEAKAERREGKKQGHRIGEREKAKQACIGGDQGEGGRGGEGERGEGEGRERACVGCSTFSFSSEAKLPCVSVPHIRTRAACQDEPLTP